ncbi:class I SAM-dependent methyltransferase [Nocardiopsis mangrovi]|uniref:Class I SAM-dependent methyltransferase n=1 Tax=Nocardiopsis mangrovi TaxID=1179818 RepID=A0ABV9DQN0_9ACTN
MSDDGARVSGIYRRADLYADIYAGRGKDYAGDAERITALVRGRGGGTASLLDVACGTGSHLAHFRDSFAHVEGVDLAEDMVRVARRDLPGVPVHTGDMRDFRLGRRFSAITCLFSSIGYLPGPAAVEAAVACFARHLEPGGVIVLEPWYFPQTALERHVVGDVVAVGGRTIARVSRNVREGAAHRMTVHYIVAHPDEGVQHFTDEHVLAVIERERYEKAFTAAGCTVEYLPGAGPGLFVGVREAG